MKIIEKQVYNEVQADGIDEYMIGFLILYLGLFFKDFESYSILIMELFKLDINPVSVGYILAFIGITIGLFFPCLVIPALRKTYRARHTYPRIGYVKLFMLDKNTWFLISILLYGGQAVLYIINDFAMTLKLFIVIYWSCVLISWKMLIGIHYKSRKSILYVCLFVMGGVLSVIFVLFELGLDYNIIPSEDFKLFTFNSLSMTKIMTGIVIITIGTLKRKKFVKEYKLNELLEETDE
jgi:hypothetical protein